jgi:hypothetical protein
MKLKFVALLISLFFLFIGMWANAQPGASLNGASWNKASFDARVFWLAGHDNGFTSALRVAASLKSLDSKNGLPPENAKDLITLRKIAIYAGAKPRILSNQEIIDEMNLFYKDFRNAPVCWVDAEPIAELALTVGAPSEQELGAIRSEDAKEGCDLGGLPSK